jgi:glycosyltransferase involved in cell wall biosynthesis
MKIFYDGAIYQIQKAGGINRYFANIINRLPASDEPVLVASVVREVNWPSHPRLKVRVLPDFRPNRVSRRAGRYACRWTTFREKPDIVHPTYYSALGMRRLNSYACPSVLTVYDFIHTLFPELDPGARFAALQKQAILDADALLCISHHTRADLLERIPSVEAKTHVIHLASEMELKMAFGPEPVPANPYFLFVGSRTFYKNFEGLVRAFARLADLPVSLAVVGSPFEEHEGRLFDELKIAHRVEYFGFAPDAHLAKLLRCSLALVYPSFYEGFGIPPLEAMQCETLVIAANTSSVPEVVGDAALLFDPRNEAELVDLLREVAANRVNREDLIARGRARAAGFTWERTAAQTVAVYRELAGR